MIIITIISIFVGTPSSSPSWPCSTWRPWPWSRPGRRSPWCTRRVWRPSPRRHSSCPWRTRPGGLLSVLPHLLQLSGDQRQEWGRRRRESWWSKESHRLPRSRLPSQSQMWVEGTSSTGYNWNSVNVYIEISLLLSLFIIIVKMLIVFSKLGT